MNIIGFILLGTVVVLGAYSTRKSAIEEAQEIDELTYNSSISSHDTQIEPNKKNFFSELRRIQKEDNDTSKEDDENLMRQVLGEDFLNELENKENDGSKDGSSSILARALTRENKIEKALKEILEGGDEDELFLFVKTNEISPISIELIRDYNPKFASEMF